MADPIEDCLHSEGLRVTSGSEYCCPVCEECLDLDGVGRWVQEAERSRDEAYYLVEGDGFGEIVRQELQREVYRRRRVMYDLENVPRVVTARPEMILVIHDAVEASYECRIFYKEPRPAGVVERVCGGAVLGRGLEGGCGPGAVVRLRAGRVEEFRGCRWRVCEDGEP